MVERLNGLSDEMVLMEDDLIFQEPASVYGIMDFQNLECWKQAAEFRRSISAVVKTFPDSEKYLLTNQLIRASRSVTANIAEGYGQYHYKDQIRFCIQARGSLVECCDHLILARDEAYINEEDTKELISHAEKTAMIINGYIKYLRKRLQENDK